MRDDEKGGTLYCESPCFPLTLKDLCEAFDFKESSLKKNFTLTYGMSITAYLQKCRVYQASRLLATTNESILEIAEKVGYKTRVNFQKYLNEKRDDPIRLSKSS